MIESHYQQINRKGGHMEIYEQCRELRRKWDIPQAMVGRQFGVTASVISTWEKGHSALPKRIEPQAVLDWLRAAQAAIK